MMGGQSGGQPAVSSSGATATGDGQRATGTARARPRGSARLALSSCWRHDAACMALNASRWTARSGSAPKIPMRVQNRCVANAWAPPPRRLASQAAPSSLHSTRPTLRGFAATAAGLRHCDTALRQHGRLHTRAPRHGGDTPARTPARVDAAALCKPASPAC